MSIPSSESLLSGIYGYISLSFHFQSMYNFLLWKANFFLADYCSIKLKDRIWLY